MKKTAILGLTALLALGFTSCDNYEEPNPAPQTNVQSAVMQVGDLAFTSATTADPYNLTTLNNEFKNILLATVGTEALPEGYSFKAVGEITNNDFANVGTFDANIASTEENPSLYDITVAPDVLDGAIKTVTKNPAQAAYKIRFKLYTVLGGQEAIIGGPEYTFGPVELTVVPMTPFTIEDTYYLYVTVNGTTEKYKFNHSDVNPYDDPKFAYKIDVTPGMKWKVVAGSANATGAPFYGVEDGNEDSTAGTLYASDATPAGVEGQLNLSGPYLLTLDMQNKTFEFTLAIEQLYTPGGSNGWNQSASQILTTTDYIHYSGYAHLDGEFKFDSTLNWSGLNYGTGDGDGKLGLGGGNLKAPQNGLYYLTADISALTYTIDYTGTWGLIGDATPGGWDTDTNLTPSADFLVWTGTVTLKEGEVKFRANDDWAINLGGNPENLTGGGDNIKLPEAGTYDVTLDFSRVPYSAKFVKK